MNCSIDSLTCIFEDYDHIFQKINLISPNFFIVLCGTLGDLIKDFSAFITQPAFTCSNLMIETLEQGVNYVQS